MSTRETERPAKTAFPVPAVRLIVTDPHGRVLILRRANTDHAPGQWCLPGGKVDYGATVEQAVRTELSEETGLDCVEAEFLFYQDSLPLEPGGMHCINLYFRCRTAGELVLNHESSAAAWVGRTDPNRPALAFRNDAGLDRFWARADSPRRTASDPEAERADARAPTD